MQNFLNENRNSRLIQSYDEYNITTQDPLKNYRKGLKSNFTVRAKYIIPSVSQIFYIPRYGYLSQIIATITLTSSMAENPQELLALRLFESIILQTERGQKPLQVINGHYIYMRIQNTEPILRQRILNGLDPQSFGLYYLPLYFFFNEDEKSFLNTEGLEKLQIKFIMNPASVYLLNGLLTSFNISLNCEYYKYQDQLTNYNFVRSMTNLTVVDSNKNLKDIILQNPNDICAIHFFLYSKTTAQYWPISSYQLQVGYKVLNFVNTFTDYSLYQEEQLVNTDVIKSYVIGTHMDRKNNNLFFNLREQNLFLTIVPQGTLPAGYNTYIIYEFYQYVDFTEREHHKDSQWFSERIVDVAT